MKNIEIIHPKFGLLYTNEFKDMVQLKLFLNLIHISITRKESFQYFNATDDLVYIPFSIEKIYHYYEDKQNYIGGLLFDVTKKHDNVVDKRNINIF